MSERRPEETARIGGDLDAREVCRKNIWCYRQNRLRYVARDLSRYAGVPIDLTRRILLARGVAKWMANRNRMLALKRELREEAKHSSPEAAKVLRGVVKRLRAIGKSDRWTLEAW